MYLIYKPADGDEQEWWFNPNDMESAEAEAIERRTGWDWAEYFIRLNAGSVLARRALLWTFLRRVHHTLRFEDVRFTMAELTLEYDQDELQRLRDEAAKDTTVTAAVQDARLEAMDEEIAKARPGLGKARSKRGG